MTNVVISKYQSINKLEVMVISSISILDSNSVSVDDLFRCRWFVPVRFGCRDHNVVSLNVGQQRIL